MITANFDPNHTVISVLYWLYLVSVVKRAVILLNDIILSQINFIFPMIIYTYIMIYTTICTHFQFLDLSA